MGRTNLIYNQGMNSHQSDSIPESAAPFFQEYTFAELDIRQDAALIIERILSYGSRSEIRWLFQQYGREAVRAWVAHAGDQRLPARRGHLFHVLLEIPQAQRREHPWNH